MLDALLMKGFLPRELPPIFSSVSLGALAHVANRLPEVLTTGRAGWTLPMHHNLSRVGGLRRRLSIPNPVNYFRLSRAFSLNQGPLSLQWDKSPFSFTKPQQNPMSTRAIATGTNDRATARALCRVGARYLLKADISQFYPSIYTHAIPWAIHTKAVAKRSTGNFNMYGNILDKELQACQNGQTKGIAIGPDTSLGIAEILLGVIDENLNASCNVLGGVRFIDDIELSFSTLSDAEGALIVLESQLYEFELQLNGNKTSIIELPGEIESAYVSKLRVMLPSTFEANTWEWIDYFNRAFELAKRHPSDGVLRYSIAALQDIRIESEVWDLVQSLLWQCIALDSGCLRLVLDIILINCDRSGHEIDRGIASRAIDALVLVSAPVGHGSEVVWSIWAAMVLEVPLADAAQNLIALMDDGCVAAAAMLAKSQGVFHNDFYSELWASWLVEDCFIQEHWLFAYECYRRNWLPEAVAHTNIDRDSAANYLKNMGVTFLADSAAVNYVPPYLNLHGIDGVY
jgi:hypothetical protein